MPAQARVSLKYTIDLASKSDCGSDIQVFQAMPGAYKVIDGRVLIPTQNPASPNGFIPLRAWKFPGPIDMFTMYMSVAEIVTLAGFAYPSLDYKILVGMGGVTDHVVTGTYTPPTKTQATDPDDMGLLAQYCGRVFDTIELHVFVDDPAHVADPLNARKFPFSVAMYAVLDRGHCESKAQTGVNGDVSFVAPTYIDAVDVNPDVVSGTATIDFGQGPAELQNTSVTVVGQTSIAAGAIVDAWLSDGPTVDHGEDEHRMASTAMGFTCGAIVPGVGFTIYATSQAGYTGTFSVRWSRCAA